MSNYATCTPCLVPWQYRDKDEEMEEFVKSMSATGRFEQVAMDNTALESGANFETFRTVAVSQALVLAGVTARMAIVLILSGHPIDMSTLHWNGSSHFMSFWDFQLMPLWFLKGIVAAVPTIFCQLMLKSPITEMQVMSISVLWTWSCHCLGAGKTKKGRKNHIFLRHQ